MISQVTGLEKEFRRLNKFRNVGAETLARGFLVLLQEDAGTGTEFPRHDKAKLQTSGPQLVDRYV
jgi:hypothetical protein